METNGLSPSSPSQFKNLTEEGNANKSSTSLDDNDCFNPMLAIETLQIICKEFIIKYKQVLKGILQLGILLLYHIFLGENIF